MKNVKDIKNPIWVIVSPDAQDSTIKPNYEQNS